MPADLAGAAVFHAGDASRYVHGAVLPVDGGWLAR
jgi:2-deoxy-D-gluconate 3-dehydrogenase